MNNTLPLAVIAGLAFGIAFIVLFIIWSNHSVGFGKFIGQLDAINAVKEKYAYLRSESLEPKFGYLKYEGMGSGIDGNSERKFSWHAADPISGEVLDLLHPKIGIDSGDAIIYDKDYYVWTISYYVPTSSHIIFIDAESGKIIGEWVPCPSCICDHNGIRYK